MPKVLQEIVMQKIVTRVETDPYWVGQGQFGQAIEKLQTIGQELGLDLRVMDGEQLALARMSYGKDSTFSTTALLVPNDHLYGNSREADILIVDKRHSPIFRNPEKATAACRRGLEFSVKEDYDKLRQLASPDASGAFKTGVLLLRRGAYSSQSKRISCLQNIPTDSFGDTDVTVFVFGEKTAANYGRWLKEEKGLDNVSHFVADAAYAARQKDPFARALWVRILELGSGLAGNNHLGIYTNGRVRGVSLVPAELAALEFRTK